MEGVFIMPKKRDKEFIIALQYIRTSLAGLTQKQLSKKSGVSIDFIKRFEEGKTYQQLFSNLKLIASVIGCDLCDIVIFPTSEELKIWENNIEGFIISRLRISYLSSKTLRLRLNQMMNNTNLLLNTKIPGLGKATFSEFFQFLAEEARKGRFWTVYENSTDRCLFLTDSAEPGLLVIPQNQYIGANRREAWRDSMNDYKRRKHLLKTEKIAPSFESKRYRMDNSFGHFQNSYYLIEGLWGTQCRASVSEGWELLRPAPDTIA